jgi:hypothetical protein
METPPFASPSFIRPKTRTLFDWDKFDALTVGLGNRAPRGSKTEATQNVPEDEKQQRLRALFDLFQQQCRDVLVKLRHSAHVCFIVMILAILLAIAGSAILAFVHSQKALGGILSATGLASLGVLLRQALAIQREIGMIGILPTKYQLAFDLANTAAQYDTVFRSFMEETSSLRTADRRR